MILKQFARQVRRFVEHPLTWITSASGVVALVWQVPFIDPLWSVLWQFSGEVLALMTVLSTQLAPQFDILPQETLQVGVILAAILFAITRIDKLYDALTERLED